MSEDQTGSDLAELEVPADAPDEDDLELIDEDDDKLEPHVSELEAGMSRGEVEPKPIDNNIAFENEESGVAQ